MKRRRDLGKLHILRGAKSEGFGVGTLSRNFSWTLRHTSWALAAGDPITVQEHKFAISPLDLMQRRPQLIRQ